MQPNHQAVARTRAKPGTDVQTARDPDDSDAKQHREQLHPEHLGSLEQRKPHVSEHANEHRIRDGPDAYALAQRNPAKQHEAADDDRDRSEAQREVIAEALGKHVPRGRPEV